MPEIVLTVDGVTKSFPDGNGTRQVLDGATLQVDAGSMVAVTGPSGCGKTTLLRVATGLLHADEGVVRVAGEVLDTARPQLAAQIRRSHIGEVAQEYGLLEADSVLDNVTLPLRFGRPRLGRRARRDAGLRALEAAALTVDPRQRVARLSGGERQRVAIARAVVRTPQLLVADEPTASLDAQTDSRIVELLRSLVREGSGVLVATHDPQVADACDVVLRFSGTSLERTR